MCKKSTADSAALLNKYSLSLNYLTMSFEVKPESVTTR